MMYGIFPIILFLMMTPLISRVFPTYLTILLWLEFWNPIYAIVNLFANLSMSRALPGVVEGQLSILTNPALAHETQTAVAVAGLATLIVPFIAYFIVSQSQYAIVGALGQILGPTTGLSQGAGASTALGNIGLGNLSLGNASFNNITANKDDRTSLHARGYIDRFSGYGDSPAIETNVGSFPFQVTGSTDLNTQIGERVSELKSSALSNVTRSAESLSSQIGQLSKVGDNYSQVRNLRTGETISLTAQQADSLSRLESIAENIHRATGVDRNTAITYALAALGAKELGLSGGLSGGTGGFGGIGILGSIGGAVRGQTQYQEGLRDNTQLSKSLQKAIDSADKSDYSNILGITDRFGKSTDLSTSSQGGTFGGSERSAGITKARGYFNEASSQLQQAESLQRIQATTVSGGVSTSFNLTPEVVRQFGNDPEALNRAFYDYVHNPESYNAQRFGKAISDYRQKLFDEQRFGGTPTIAAGVGIVPPNVERNQLEQLKLSQPESKDSVREFGKEERRSIGSGGVSLPQSIQVDEKIEGIRGNVEHGHENIHSDRGNLQTEFGGEKSKAQGEVHDFNPSLPRSTGNATLGFDPEHGKRAGEAGSDPYSPQVYQKEVPEPGGTTKTIIVGNPAKEELKSLDDKVVVPEEYRKKGK
jgi:hypothetical protein